MPDITRATNQELQTLDLAMAIDAFTPQLVDALPESMSIQRFKRVVITAINTNPELRNADRRSLFNACIKCALDGLYPDGREAALVMFGRSAQYLPMIAGLRKRMRNSGEVLSAIAEVVHQHDHFRDIKGEDAHIEHEPTPFGKDRGPIVGAYAIIKLANGEVLRDVMSTEDIERVRRVFSKTPDGPAWTKSWPEMAKKTVLHRCYKMAPADSATDRVFSRDNETTEEPTAPPLPTRVEFSATAPSPDIVPPQEPDEVSDDVATDAGPVENRYELVDSDGAITSYETYDAVLAALGGLISEAAMRGLPAIEAVWIDNQATRELMWRERAEDPTLEQLYEAAKRAVSARELRKQTAAAPVSTAPAPRPRGRPRRDSMPPQPQTPRPSPEAAENSQTPTAANELRIPWAPGTKSQVELNALYNALGKKLTELSQRDAPPPDYTRFAELNRDALQDIRTSWPAFIGGLERRINAGEQG